MDQISRRTVLATAGGLTTVLVAGCSGSDGSGGGSDVTEVSVGPDDNYLRFVPEEVTVSTGDTVRWVFESEGHNVSAVPDHDGKITLPDGADPFATYGDDETRFTPVEVGETFEHTFDTAGEYVYVCIPHSDQGMVGTVTVE